MLLLDTLEGETEGHRLIVVAIVGHAGRIAVSISHGGEGGRHRLQHIGMGGGIVDVVELTMEGEGGAQALDGVTGQTVVIGALVAALHHLF